MTRQSIRYTVLSVVITVLLKPLAEQVDRLDITLGVLLAILGD